MLMPSNLTITMMMIVIEQTGERGTEFLSTSLLPPVLQIVKLIHVRGENIAVSRKEKLSSCFSTIFLIPTCKSYFVLSGRGEIVIILTKI